MREKPFPANGRGATFDTFMGVGIADGLFYINLNI